MAIVCGSYIRRVVEGVVPVCEMAPLPAGDDLVALADWMEAAALAAERNEVLEFSGGFGGVPEVPTQEVDGGLGCFPCGEDEAAVVEPVRVVGVSETGFCYADTFVEAVRPAVVEALGPWPSVVDVVQASARFEMLADEELARLLINIIDDKIHIGVESGSMTALDLVESVRACWRSGTLKLYEKMRVGGGSLLASQRDERFGKLREAVVVDTHFEEEAARCHVGGENCWVSTMARLVGVDVCVGRMSVHDVVTGPAFLPAARAVGDPYVVVWTDHDGRAVHVAPVPPDVEDSGQHDVDVVRLTWLPGLINKRDRCCWVETGLVRDFPEVPSGQQLCGRCGCVAAEQGHEARCFGVSTTLGRQKRDDAWLGDAVHVLDVRRVVLEAGVSGDVAVARSQPYVEGVARAAWYRLHVYRGERELVDEEAARLFVAQYVGHRSQYVRWLQAVLPCVPEGVGTAVAVVDELERGFQRLCIQGRVSDGDRGPGVGDVGDHRSQAASRVAASPVSVSKWVVVPMRHEGKVTCGCPVPICNKYRRGTRWLDLENFRRHMELHDAHLVGGDTPGSGVEQGMVFGCPISFVVDPGRVKRLRGG